MKKLLFVIISFLIFLLIGCNTSQQNIFTEEKAKVGDKICSMEIKKITDNGKIIYFTRQTTLSGKFVFENDETYFGKIVTFTPDKNSIIKVPKLKNDDRLLWFVLTNYDQAVKMFGSSKSEGKATIVIDNYMIDSNATETYNEAELVKVLKIN